MIRTLIGLFVGLLNVFLLVGCSGSTGTVTGVVTVDGNPLTGATVNFIGSDGVMVSAGTDESGRYRAENVPAGEVKVSVTAVEGDVGIQAQAEDIKKRGPGAPPPLAPPANTPLKSKVNPKYNDPATSGLKVTVSGNTKFDIPVTR
jgi:hypothetical protein